MATYSEAYLGIVWIVSTLTADATLTSLAPGGVWRGLADPGTLTPYFVVNLQSGGNTVTTNGVRLFSTPLYQVKCVGPTTIDDAIHSAASRAEALLGGPPGRAASGPIILNGVTVGQMLSCYQQSSVFMDEIVSGEVWTNIGGLYTTEVQQFAS